MTPLPRDQFPVADRFRYLNHARAAAPPTVVAHALARDASAATMLGATTQDRREARSETVRRTLAGLVGTDTDNISFVPNTIHGLALVLHGLAWEPGDQVVVATGEYPLITASAQTLESRDVGLVAVALTDDRRLDPATLDEALAHADRVRLIVVSWVDYATGARNDIAALARVARRHGAWLVVDAIQGLGVLPADMAAWGVDAVVAGGHKWLLGPQGTGILATTPTLRATLNVTTPGWHLIDANGRLDPEADLTGRRFDPTTANLGGIGGLGAAADLLVGTGIDSIWHHVDAWCDHLVGALTDLGAQVLSPRGDDARSAIVTARFPEQDAGRVVDRLMTRGVVAHARHGGVRFSPHGWNDDEDLSATVEAIGQVLRG